MDKQLYIQSANQLKGWQKMSISDLAFKYVEGDMQAACISGIICKMWPFIEGAYNKQQYKFATLEDIYDCAVDSVLRALEERAWLNPDSTLYQDPIGPEKAINVCFKCTKINMFEYLGRYKRRLNNGILSLEELQVDKPEGIYIPYIERDITVYDMLIGEIRKFYIEKKYAKAFTVFSILNCDVFKVEEVSNFIIFDLKYLNSIIKNLDDKFCSIFADEVDLDFKDVQNACVYVRGYTDKKLEGEFERIKGELRSDKMLINLLEGGVGYDYE